MLYVITVPPGIPLIMDAQGNEVAAVAGPFYEGYDLQISCHVAGGMYIDFTDMPIKYELFYLNYFQRLIEYCKLSFKFPADNNNYL